jgi:hypothetical protein
MSIPQPTQIPYPLHVRPAETSGKEAFEGDLFQRQSLAIRLTGLISRIKTGGVIAIDAPWGDGKTWFVENWELSLKAQGYQTAFLNVFKHDHVEDPFTMLCSEVITKLDINQQDKSTLFEKGKIVAKSLIPLLAKALITYGTKASSGLSLEEFQTTIDEFGKDVADQTRDSVADVLGRFDEDKQSVDAFFKILTDHAASQKKPLVVFIDELDRCRPDFAVRTIERIKHFFDVPNIIFVLSVNRAQIAAYVRGVYGIGDEADQYLGKFILFWLKLPKANSLDIRGLNHSLIYCNELARKYGLNDLGETANFNQLFSFFATKLSLALRDLERGFTLYSLAMPLSGYHAILSSWPIALKLSNPNLFYGILSGDSNASREAIKLLEFINNPSGSFSHLIYFFIELHNLIPGDSNNRTDSLSEESQTIISQFGNWPMPSPWVSNPAGYIPWLFGKIDLHVES